MATPPSSVPGPAEWLIEAADHTHTCRICYEEFNDKAKVARLLVCGHTFCTLCLSTLTRVNRQVYPTCPECRKVTRQPVATLPINFQLMQILRKMNLTVENTEVEETSSTIATAGLDNDSHIIGELELDGLIEDSPMEEIIAQIKNRLSMMKDKIAEEIFTTNTYNDGSFHLNDCLSRLNSIDDIIETVDQTYRTAQELHNMESYLDNAEPSDIDFQPSESDDASIVSRHSEYNESPEYLQHLDNVTEMLANVVVGYGAVSTNMSDDGWTNSHYTSDVFVTDMNSHGQNVLRCQVCMCQLPYGCENSHANGRRHQANQMRRLANLPIMERSQWQRHRRNNPPVYNPFARQY